MRYFCTVVCLVLEHSAAHRELGVEEGEQVSLLPHGSLVRERRHGGNAGRAASLLDERRYGDEDFEDLEDAEARLLRSARRRGEEEEDLEAEEEQSAGSAAGAVDDADADGSDGDVTVVKDIKDDEPLDRTVSEEFEADQAKDHEPVDSVTVSADDEPEPAPGPAPAPDGYAETPVPTPAGLLHSEGLLSGLGKKAGKLHSPLRAVPRDLAQSMPAEVEVRKPTVEDLAGISKHQTEDGPLAALRHFFLSCCAFILVSCYVYIWRARAKNLTPEDFAAAAAAGCKDTGAKADAEPSAADAEPSAADAEPQPDAAPAAAGDQPPPSGSPESPSSPSEAPAITAEDLARFEEEKPERYPLTIGHIFFMLFTILAVPEVNYYLARHLELHRKFTLLHYYMFCLHGGVFAMGCYQIYFWSKTNMFCKQFVVPRTRADDMMGVNQQWAYVYNLLYYIFGAVFPLALHSYADLLTVSTGFVLMLCSLSVSWYFFPTVFQWLPGRCSRLPPQVWLLKVTQYYDIPDNNAFPSAHCAVAVFFDRLLNPVLGSSTILFPLLIATSCVKCNQHNIIDCVGGLCWGLLAWEIFCTVSGWGLLDEAAGPEAFLRVERADIAGY